MLLPYFLVLDQETLQDMIYCCCFLLFCYFAVESDCFWRKTSFGARDRGEYEPELKLHTGNKITKITPKYCNVANETKGYYPMKSKKHGVALIINNKIFTKQSKRDGTDRDEHNLIETWRYLGYHVEVRRDVKEREIWKIVDNIDTFLSESSTTVANDSFVCCILSHGDECCIYSSDSKEVQIKDLERRLGGSETLRSKPKLFFIQACQGKGKGTKPVQCDLQADGDKMTTGRADIYIAYATVSGDMCYRHTQTGSWFIGVVCKTLCLEATCCSLTDMQISFNTGVSDEPDFVYEDDKGEKFKQQPCFCSQLRKKLHFFYI